MIEAIVTLLIMYYTFGIGVGVGMNKAVDDENDFEELVMFGLTWPRVFFNKQ